MKKFKKILPGCLIVFALAVTSITAFAASTYQTPAEAAADLTGKSMEEVLIERQSGKSYGMIANEAGKLKEFQQAMLDSRKDILDNRVADGSITQEQADAQITAMEQRQAICDGTGTGCGGYGRGFGSGNGQGRGQGRGFGRGMGLRNGSCLYQ